MASFRSIIFFRSEISMEDTRYFLISCFAFPSVEIHMIILYEFWLLFLPLMRIKSRKYLFSYFFSLSSKKNVLTGDPNIFRFCSAKSLRGLQISK